MISLREYLESKNALVQAYLKNPTTSSTYMLLKYCRVPVVVETKIKYIQLRPNDLVEVVSLTHDETASVHHLRFICEHNLSIVDDKFLPKWSTSKIMKWVRSNATPIDPSTAQDMLEGFEVDW